MFGSVERNLKNILKFVLSATVIALFAPAQAQAQGVSVKSFGAVCDGAADDTAAFRKAAASPGLAKGGILLVPAGNCLVSATIAPPNFVVVQGEGVRASVITCSVASAPCFKFGTSDTVFNNGGGARDLQINLTNKTSTGIKLNATVNAEIRNVRVEGYTAVKDNTRTNICIDIDGRNVSAFFNSIQNVQAAHCHRGFVVRSTGTTGATQQVFINCFASSNFEHGDTTGIGFHFIDAGDSTVIIGGDVESNSIGLWLQGGANTASVNAFGLRFEGNKYDIVNDASHGKNGQLVAIGSSTLDPAKMLDNSGHSRNIIQYGVAGTLASTRQAVAAGYTSINGSADGSFACAISGPVAGSGECFYSRYGKNVTLTVPTFRAAGRSAAAPIRIAGLPPALSPVSTFYSSSLKVTDDGADLAAPGQVSIATGGAITISKDTAGGGFVSTTKTTGFYGFTVSYRTP